MFFSNTLFPARESLVSDIPAGNGKIANLFYIVNATKFHGFSNQGEYDWLTGNIHPRTRNIWSK
jgi:hypothetical protein